MEVGSGKERIVEEPRRERGGESCGERRREREGRERLGKAPSIRGTNKISGQEHFQRFMARLHQVKQAQRRKEARGGAKEEREENPGKMDRGRERRRRKERENTFFLGLPFSCSSWPPLPLSRPCFWFAGPMYYPEARGSNPVPSRSMHVEDDGGGFHFFPASAIAFVADIKIYLYFASN